MPALLTSDDGIVALGLVALRRPLVRHCEVSEVAPATAVADGE